MESPQSVYLLYNNQSLFEQKLEENRNSFTSPIIPHMQASQTLEIGGVFTTIFPIDYNRQCIDKTHWITDYADDIFQTLRESELSRRFVCFRSQQVYQRPILLKLLRTASEKYKLSRTTLHLAVYLLDCFMDNYTIRADKLNLSAITCLIIAAKIEQADIDMPKFADLNKQLNEVYTLNEFRNVECKILGTFNFDLIRPTTATFAEYFANGIITLQDYHLFKNHWNNEMIINNYHYQHQQQDLQTRKNNSEELINTRSCIVFGSPCPYSSYENMLATLTETFFDLIDVSLNYLKFANVRPSIVAATCIAAVRQIYGIFPIWTPYLIKLTQCTSDMILPFVETILAIYRIYYNNEQLKILQTPNNALLSTAGLATTLYDSPDSGVVSGNDTKSTISDSDDNEDDCVVVTNERFCSNISVDSDDQEDDEASYHCLDYPKPAKRRRLL